MIPYPNINPIIVQIGPLALRWYGLMYLIGLTSAYFFIRSRVTKQRLPMSADHVYDMIVFGALGVFLGGRLGYVLFYNLPYYLQNPLKIVAVWEGGMVALLNQQTRQEAMGVDEETWRTHDDDKINAVIQQKHKDMPLDEVLKTFRDTHQRLVAKIQSLSDEDLERPYSYYQSHSKRETPVWHFIVGNTYMHYQAHKPWIAAIVSDGQERSE